MSVSIDAALLVAADTDDTAIQMTENILNQTWDAFVGEKHGTLHIRVRNVEDV